MIKMVLFNFRKNSSSSVDRGWAWIVLCAIILMGIGTRYFTERTMVMTAAIIGLSANIGNAYAPSAGVLFLTQSFLFAISCMCAHLPSMLMVGKYFEKRRGMANGIANVGGSLGGLALPLLLTFLFNEYGLEGTLILSGGIFLHFLPIGLLMQPIEREGITNVNEKKDLTKIDKDGAHENFLSSNEKDSGINDEYEKQNTSTHSNHSLNKPFNSGSFANRNSGHMTNGEIKSVELFGSSIDIGSTVSMEKIDTIYGKNNPDSNSVSSRKERNCCVRFLFTLFNFSLLKDAKFILLMSSSFFVTAGCSVAVTYIAPFAKDQGLQSNMIGYLVTISAGGDLAGRCLFVFIADNRKLQRHHMMTIAMIANGITFFMASFCNDFVSLSIFSVSQAAFGGTYYSLINVLVVDFVGLENLRHGLAMTTVTRGLSIAITSTLIGLIRDETGSYVGGYYLMGTSLVLGGLLLLLKPLISK
ncbi:monocarboxylate transporter 14-like isoform X2 [Ostrea edulis]|uniref:monocarboxylate transporter 14-like isoform X2 n=1 Tax=Ostrea edulis TaxID=37623 RepID=UPI0020943B2D|nr:monocarboxylate transporter 14-like isoform X2 [Ostrea edulis]